MICVFAPNCSLVLKRPGRKPLNGPQRQGPTTRQRTGGLAPENLAGTGAGSEPGPIGARRVPAALSWVRQKSKKILFLGASDVFKGNLVNICLSQGLIPSFGKAPLLLCSPFSSGVFRPHGIAKPVRLGHPGKARAAR